MYVNISVFQCFIDFGKYASNTDSQMRVIKLEIRSILSTIMKTKTLTPIHGNCL